MGWPLGQSWQGPGETSIRQESPSRPSPDQEQPPGRHWAFAALTVSLGAHAHYKRRRDTGDRYYVALRRLFNRMLGQLHHCLTTRQKFDEAIGFAPPTLSPLATAA
ncbi:hypothetical protein GCM10009646_78500 [Streptomyces aureus]